LVIASAPFSHSVLGTRPICDENAFERERVDFIRGAVAVDAAPVTFSPSPVTSVVSAEVMTVTLGRLRSFGLQTRHRRAASLSNSISVTWRDDAGEVDRGLDPRIAAANHGGALALVERTIAVRAVGDALACDIPPRPARRSAASARL
jgi:hypothetical protein